jgi:hypothetical protein
VSSTGFEIVLSLVKKKMTNGRNRGVPTNDPAILCMLGNFFSNVRKRQADDELASPIFEKQYVLFISSSFLSSFLFSFFLHSLLFILFFHARLEPPTYQQSNNGMKERGKEIPPEFDLHEVQFVEVISVT